MKRICPDISGYVNEDLPNSWECPKCCKSGKNSDYKPRHFRARQKSSDMRRMSISSDASGAFEIKIQPDHASDSGGENEQKEVVMPPITNDPIPVKKRRNSEGDGGDIQTQVAVSNDPTRKQAFRFQLAQQLSNSTSKILKKPTHVVRPAPILTNIVPSNNMALDKRCILPLFKYLTPSDLYTCALVCKTWAQYSIDPSLWKRMHFVQKHISSEHLKGIVRRQPEVLLLDWCHINKYQLPWLIQRLTNLRELSLISVNVKSVVSLRNCYCAQLQVLTLSHVTNFNDSALREILATNHDSHRGLTDEKIRFRNLRRLRLAGTDVTDVALRYVTQYLPNLNHLNLSQCPRISDAGIAQLCTKPAATVINLISLNLSGTKLVTELSLEHLSKCENLVRLDLRYSAQVSTQALIKFAAKSDRDLHVRDIKLVDKRQVAPS